MDDLFLQILTANENAKNKVDNAQGSQSDYTQLLNQSKKAIDEKALFDFENKLNAHYKKNELIRQEAQDSMAKKLVKQKEILKQDFDEISKKHKDQIMAKVTSHHGQ